MSSTVKLAYVNVSVPTGSEKDGAGWRVTVYERNAVERGSTYMVPKENSGATADRVIKKANLGKIDSVTVEEKLPTRFVWCLPEDVEAKIVEMKDELKKVVEANIARWKRYEAAFAVEDVRILRSDDVL